MTTRRLRKFKESYLKLIFRLYLPEPRNEPFISFLSSPVAVSTLSWWSTTCSTDMMSSIPSAENSVLPQRFTSSFLKYRARAGEHSCRLHWDTELSPKSSSEGSSCSWIPFVSLVSEDAILVPSLNGLGCKEAPSFNAILEVILPRLWLVDCLALKYTTNAG